MQILKTEAHQPMQHRRTICRRLSPVPVPKHLIKRDAYAELVVRNMMPTAQHCRAANRKTSLKAPPQNRTTMGRVENGITFSPSGSLINVQHIHTFSQDPSGMALCFAFGSVRSAAVAHGSRCGMQREPAPDDKMSTRGATRGKFETDSIGLADRDESFDEGRVSGLSNTTRQPSTAPRHLKRICGQWGRKNATFLVQKKGFAAQTSVIRGLE